MNHSAAALAPTPSSGANVGPRVVASSPVRASGPSTPSQTTGRTMKYSEAMPAEAKIARGTSFS